MAVGYGIIRSYHRRAIRRLRDSFDKGTRTLDSSQVMCYGSPLLCLPIMSLSLCPHSPLAALAALLRYSERFRLKQLFCTSTVHIILIVSPAWSSCTTSHVTLTHIPFIVRSNPSYRGLCLDNSLTPQSSILIHFKRLQTIE